MNIYLVRHTAVNVQAGTCYGHTDVGLKDSFEAEALEVKKQLETIKFDRVYSSPLRRCTHLAEACGYTDFIKDERLMELNFGNWEMQRFDDIKDPVLNDWYKDYINVIPTNGESFANQLKRTSEFMNELVMMKNIKNVLIFTHSGVQLCARVWNGEFKLNEAFEHTTGYGSIITLKTDVTD
ncbi:alpha-ribazole phosphatase [Porphyromonas pogonae]|uniref:alpha-ribazole phosphatase n=1 Tax=Porphyromonas pogonae TaxID=867595 RepID=UPI002E78B586|nr:alpha-ribazole phosphatase [Porphyromonas pogonae]